MKNILKQMYIKAALLNDENVIMALASCPKDKNLLDVGCWDGIKTMKYSNACSARNTYGIEPIKFAAEKARSIGIETFEISADSQKWPIKDNEIDCIVSNQVVEHLSNLDHYFREASRTLKKGGCLITSTNNLSSWHNIISLLFGFAPFDLTNCSSKAKGLGNPFAVHRNETDERGSTWTHKCIYTAAWLKDWQNIYGLKTVKIYGSGYYPFHEKLGRLLPLHSAFITIVAKKE